MTYSFQYIQKYCKFPIRLTVHQQEGPKKTKDGGHMPIYFINNMVFL